ncbi:unnamed protein product [Sphenostylis stenocarpa]|uniref:60S ribosomal protein L34 n=1 Tax=Sphenostylis stenocarpa TaxID=92480 RepID=A0AA86VVJ6_9FABA|nr:unnamed protein product [Sphenostylis stenocarpa]
MKHPRNFAALDPSWGTPGSPILWNISKFSAFSFLAYRGVDTYVVCDLGLIQFGVSRVVIEMVYFHSSISLCNSSVDQPMANSLDFAKSRHRKTPNSPQYPPCRRSRSAVVDVVIFVAVVAAFGFLLFPYAQIVASESVKIGAVIVDLVKEEVSVAPWVYMFIGVSVTFAALTTWVLVACTTRKCGNPNCKGLRKAAEFDIQLETEDCVKNSPSLTKDGGVKKGLFKLPCDHHRELEAELKKMAPPNGRAVLILRARCGCSVGRLEVPGPKKNRKIKK